LIEYLVTFDRALGYPVTIEVKAKENTVADIDSETTVESLRVVKRGTPGVP
jgi:hypothetical protein